MEDHATFDQDGTLVGMARLNPRQYETVLAHMWRRVRSWSMVVFNLRKIFGLRSKALGPQIHPSGYALRRAPRWSDYEQARDGWTHEGPDWQLWGRRGVDHAKHNTLMIRDLCASHGAVLTVVVYPWPRQLRNQWDARFLSLVWSSLAEEDGIRLVDLTPGFLEIESWRSYFIPGDNHWNEKGHQLVADLLHRSLGSSSGSRPDGAGPSLAPIQPGSH